MRGFADRLREARQASAMTQAELAERIGLAAEAYGRLERGLSLPRADNLVRIARALGVSTDHLLGVEGAPHAPAAAQAPEPYTAAGNEQVRRLARRLQRAQQRAGALAEELLKAVERQGRR